MLFNDALQQFSNYRAFQGRGSSVKGYDLILRQFCLYMHNPHIEDVKIGDIISYLQEMVQLGWDRNSFMPKCIAFRKFFEFFRKQGFLVLHEELIPIPRQDHFKLPRIMSEETYTALISSLPTETNDPRFIRNNALIRMYWDTLARNTELLSVNIPDLDLEKRRTCIATEKNMGSAPIRNICWRTETHEYLIRWIEVRERLNETHPFRDQNALFVGIGSDRYGVRLTKRGVGELLRRQAIRAGIKPGTAINAHSMRHHGGREIIKRGGSTSDVMNILGHASVNSTTIYTRMVGDDLADRWQTIFEDKGVSFTH